MIFNTVLSESGERTFLRRLPWTKRASNMLVAVRKNSEEVTKLLMERENRQK